MKPQTSFWFLRTHNSTIYGNDNINKLFTKGRHIWDELIFFFCMYDPLTYPKYISAKHYLFKVRSMQQNFQRNFELYCDPARDLSIEDKTIGFQGRNKGTIRITFKYAGYVFQADSVCDIGYTYSLIYCNNDIPESKNHLCATNERVIWLFKRLKTECNHV